MAALMVQVKEQGEMLKWQGRILHDQGQELMELRALVEKQRLELENLEDLVKSRTHGGATIKQPVLLNTRKGLCMVYEVRNGSTTEMFRDPIS